MTEQELTNIMRQYKRLYNKKPGPGADPELYQQIDDQQKELLSQLVVWFDMEPGLLDVTITDRMLTMDEKVDFIMDHYYKKQPNPHINPPS